MAAGQHFNVVELEVSQSPVPLLPPQETAPLPAVIYQVSGSLVPNAAAGVWVQLFNLANVAPGAVPIRSYYVAIGASFSLGLEGPYGDKGQAFDVNPVFALSTTRDEYQQVAATEIVTVHATGRLLA